MHNRTDGSNETVHREHANELNTKMKKTKYETKYEREGGKTK